MAGGREQRQPAADDQETAVLGERLTGIKELPYVEEMAANTAQQIGGSRTRVRHCEIVDGDLELLECLRADLTGGDTTSEFHGLDLIVESRDVVWPVDTDLAEQLAHHLGLDLERPIRRLDH